ncbi:hypothetical protein A3K89_05570 [Rhodococcoides kyotonense]|uniref:ANTAR domain-containing protein n=2 Tax=Mycobacteriales TaxID=85007 RepID=A0A177YHT6_9NOCA|nr:hypothetical protein A3K89_05570 [Rhodococcus kyotonensis]
MDAADIVPSNAREVEMTDNTVPVTTRLASVSGMLTAPVHRDSHEILDTIAQQAMAVVSGSCAAVVASYPTSFVVAASTDESAAPPDSVFMGVASTSVATNAVVVVDDTAEPSTRWAAFASDAVGVGLAAVRAYPIRIDGGPVGAVVVGTEEPWMRTPRDAMSVQVLADLAGAALRLSDDGERRHRSDAVRADAADTADTEFAVGIIAERHGLDIGAAHDVLRGLARRTGSPIVDVARRIAAGGDVVIGSTDREE